MRRPLDPRDIPDELRRRLGLLDAVVIGLGSMIGAGIFAALAPAAYAAGSGLLLGLAVAAVVAYCNAISSARLAARYPASGGTYVYGRMRLGDFWGYLAGWGFVVGKTASCAAMALTVGFYVWPAQAHAVAVAVVVALTAVNYAGIQKSAWLTRSIVAVVLVVLTAVVVAAYGSGAADPARLDIGVDAHVWGMLQAAGLLFFAFAGYARIATLGEEVRDPARTIPRAIPLALPWQPKPASSRYMPNCGPRTRLIWSHSCGLGNPPRWSATESTTLRPWPPPTWESRWAPWEPTSPSKPPTSP